MNYKLLEASDVIGPVLPPEAIIVREDTEIQVGDFVKIAVKSGPVREIFWATVYALDKDIDKFGVHINQDLRFTLYHELRDGDSLAVKRKNIIAIIK